MNEAVGSLEPQGGGCEEFEGTTAAPRSLQFGEWHRLKTKQKKTLMIEFNLKSIFFFLHEMFI